MVCQADVGRLCDPGRHARRPRAVPDTIAPDTDMPQTSQPGSAARRDFLDELLRHGPIGSQFEPTRGTPVRFD